MPVFTVSEEQYREALKRIPELEGEIQVQLGVILVASGRVEQLREARRRRAELIENYWYEHGDDQRSRYP